MRSVRVKTTYGEGERSLEVGVVPDREEVKGDLRVETRTEGTDEDELFFRRSGLSEIVKMRHNN